MRTPRNEMRLTVNDKGGGQTSRLKVQERQATLEGLGYPGLSYQNNGGARNHNFYLSTGVVVQHEGEMGCCQLQIEQRFVCLDRVIQLI